jgi:hypothetical protein
MIYFSDVDVVRKLAACGFLPWLPELLGVSDEKMQIRYLASLQAHLRRPSKRLANVRHQKELEAFCSMHSIVDDASDPVRQQELLLGGMDPGEALLFAEAEVTGGIVVTGDKRALAAYAKLSTATQRACLNVVCWEQLLLRVRSLRGYEALRIGCCGALDCDGLLSLAFSSGLVTVEDHAVAAIESYLGGVREHLADILVVFDP